MDLKEVSVSNTGTVFNLTGDSPVVFNPSLDGTHAICINGEHCKTAAVADAVYADCVAHGRQMSITVMPNEGFKLLDIKPL